MHSTAVCCAPFCCCRGHTSLIDPPSTTPCELWPGTCALHQWTTFPSSQASNLLSFVAMEPHYLWYAEQWSLDICSTERSPVHRVQIHGSSNRGTRLYLPYDISSVHLTTITYVRPVGGSPMECIVDGQHHKTPHFHPRHRYPPPGMTLTRRACVRVNCLRTDVGRFRSCLYKWGMVSFTACEWGAE